MKKIVIAAAAIFAVVLVILGILTAVFWEEIEAAIYAARYSSEDLENMKNENQQMMQNAVFKISEDAFTELSQEQTAKLLAGELQMADAVNIVLNRDKAPQCETKYDKDKNLVLEKVAEVFVLKSSFTFQLNSMFNEAKADYIALPAGDKRDIGKLAALLDKYGGRAGVMEKECDGKMDALCTEIAQLLPKVNGDESVVSDIKYIYAQEKTLTKAYYMDIYTSKISGLK